LRSASPAADGSAVRTESGSVASSGLMPALMFLAYWVLRFDFCFTLSVRQSVLQGLKTVTPSNANLSRLIRMGRRVSYPATQNG
jgi:hypothetical protein